MGMVFKVRQVGGLTEVRLATVDGRVVPALPAGVRDLARRYGVGPGAVCNWPKRYDDFPDEMFPTSGGPVFDAYAVDRWRAARGWSGPTFDREES